MYSVSTSFIKRYQALHMFSGHPYCLEFKMHQIHMEYFAYIYHKKTNHMIPTCIGIL